MKHDGSQDSTRWTAELAVVLADGERHNFVHTTLSSSTDPTYAIQQVMMTATHTFNARLTNVNGAIWTVGARPHNRDIARASLSEGASA